MKHIGDKVIFEGKVLGTISDLVEERQSIRDRGNRIWRIEKIDRGNKEYLVRIGYYTDYHKRKKQGFIWTNRPATLSADILESLLNKAKQKGIIK